MHEQKNKYRQIVRPEKLFRAGIEKLSHQEIKSAIILFRNASNSGHDQAKKYLTILRNNRHSLALWCDIILSAEKQYM